MKPSAATSLRSLPSVDALLRSVGPIDLPREVVVREIREYLRRVRRGRRPSGADITAAIQSHLSALSRQRLQPLINATGIVLHTNFGRAPLSAGAIAALTDAAAHYTNLEFDLAAGERGGRASHLERLLAALCQSEAAAVVNNGAAALVLVALHAIGGLPPSQGLRRSEIIISRGELVQIGGGFRIPEILEASGARLREVGTTNQTALADYARAIGPETALILRVHRSNFYMEGFVSEAPRDALAALAREHGIPLAEDLGSGAVFPTEKLSGLEHEVTPSEVLRGGADLVLFSGDKLFGGPQAGIIAGAASRITALKKEPFFRALRCDKLTLAALEATALSHLAGTAARDLPALSLLGAAPAELRSRAERLAFGWRDLPAEVRIAPVVTEVGGGSLPRSKLPSVALEIQPRSLSPPELARRLALGLPPVIGSIRRNWLRLDLRTVFPRQDGEIARGVRAAFAADPAVKHAG